MTISVEDNEGHTFGYVVVDSVVNGTSSGGVRIVEDVSLEEIKTLAREMTLKYSFIGLPRGGTKAGIRVPQTASEAEKNCVLKDFGRRIAPLIRAGIYYPGMDMNCSAENLRQIYHGAGLCVRKVTDTSFFTGLSVANSVYACAESYNAEHRVFTVAIEGFGSVGKHLVEHLPEDKFRITAVSTVKGGIYNESGLPVRELIRARDQYGDDFVKYFKHGSRVEKTAVLSQNVDILVPCARTHTINENNVQTIGARFIVPAANAPYTQGASRVLQVKGIRCLPGFVCNAGGVFGSSLYDSGVRMTDIESVSSKHFRRVVKELLKTANSKNLSPVDIAYEVARYRFESQNRRSGKMKRLQKLLARAFRKRMILRNLYAFFVLRQFQKNLRDLEDMIASSDYTPLRQDE